MQRLFTEPTIESDPDLVKVNAYQVQHLSTAQGADLFQGGRFVQVGIFRTLLSENLARQVVDVLTHVAVGRELGSLAQRLFVTGQHGGVKEVHLGAGVVYVVFPGNLIARGGKDVGQRTAQNRAPGVADVHRPGGVDADKLHHHAATEALLDVSELLAQGPNSFHLLLDPAIPKPEIDEPRRRGFRAVNLFNLRDVLDQGFGQRQGVDAGRPG